MQMPQSGILNSIPPPQSVGGGFPMPTPQQNKSPQQAMAEEVVGGGIPPALSALMKEQQALQLLQAAASEKQMQYQPPTPPTVKGQVESGIASTLSALQPGMNIKGQRMAEEAALRPAAGMPGMPAPNMNQMASGGIVGYAQGGNVSASPIPTMGAVPKSPVGDAQIKQFANQYMAITDSINKAQTPESKMQAQQHLQELKGQMGNEQAAVMQYIDSTKGILAGPGMAIGGSVGGDSNLDIEALLDSLMMAESGGDPNAVGAAGEEGAFQILPSTARQPGFRVRPIENSFDPVESRRFARDYLQAMLDRYDGDVEAALIAYNAGFGNADKFMASGRDMSVLPQRRQTEPYVRKIMDDMRPERTLDFAGGRQITTQEPEGYSERMRREKLERNEAGIAALMPTAPVAEEEVVEPTGGIAALQNMGRKQQARRDAFSQAAPEAQGAVNQYADDKEQGGIASLRRVGEKQDNQRAKVDSAVDYLRMQQESQNMVNQADPAARGAQPAGKPSVAEIVKFLRMQQESQDMVNQADPAANIKGYNGEDGSLVEADTDEAIARRNNLMAMLSAAVSSQSQGNKEEARANAPTIPDALALAMEEAARGEEPQTPEDAELGFFARMRADVAKKNAEGFAKQGNPRALPNSAVGELAGESFTRGDTDPEVKQALVTAAAAERARNNGIISQAEYLEVADRVGSARASEADRIQAQTDAEAQKFLESLGVNRGVDREVKKFDAETFPDAQAAAGRYAAQGGAPGRQQAQEISGIQAEIAALENKEGLDLNRLIAMLSNSESVTTAGALGSMGRAGAEYGQAQDNRRQELKLGLNEQKLKRDAAMAAQEQRQATARARLDAERRDIVIEFTTEPAIAYKTRVAQAAGIELNKVTQADIDEHGPAVQEAYLNSIGFGMGASSPGSQGNPMFDTTGYSAKLIE